MIPSVARERWRRIAQRRAEVGVDGAPLALRWLPFGAQRRPRMRRGFHSPSAEGHPASHQIPISICMPPAPCRLLHGCAQAPGKGVAQAALGSFREALVAYKGAILRARGNLCATALVLRVHLALRWLSFGAQTRSRTRRGYISPSAWKLLSYRLGFDGVPPWV